MNTEQHGQFPSSLKEERQHGNLSFPCAFYQYLEQAVVFSPELLTFAAPDPTQEQFLLPLSEHKLSFPSFLGPDHPAFLEIQQEFFRIRSIFFRENRFYSDQFTIENPISQLRLKASLLNIIGTLAEYALLTSNEPVRNPRVELLKTVISYIRQNYQQPLSLGELAALAGMNEQYFCRFFQKYSLFKRKDFYYAKKMVAQKNSLSDLPEKLL